MEDNLVRVMDEFFDYLDKVKLDFRKDSKEAMKDRKLKKNDVSLDELMEDNNFNHASPDNPENELLEAEELLQQHQDFLKYQSKINDLPLKYQEALVLRYFEQKQIKEIGIILGKSEGTIKSLIHRGLEKLKNSFEKIE